MRALGRARPMTVLSMTYTVVVLLLVWTGLVEASSENVIRLCIAGFLLVFAAVLVVIAVFYLPAAVRDDWRGLLPRHVVKVTLASALTILWVCMELWARTIDETYLPPLALLHAAVAAALWLWSLSDVMRFERRRVDVRTRSVELRGRRRKEDG